jgi:hypothetical protein
MTAPLTVLPAVAAGAAGVALAYRDHDSTEQTVALAGGAAAAALGAALILEEQNYIAGGALALAGLAGIFLLLKR